MDATACEILSSVCAEILKNRKDVLTMACQQRAKFEGWLKFELAVAIGRKPGISDVIIEDSYKDKGRSDISFRYMNEKYQVEMKTANTNWRVNGVENLTRPITMNIDGIIDDIGVLKLKCPPNHGLAVFTMFPIPQQLLKYYPERLHSHLRRIEKETELGEASLSRAMKLVPITEDYGVGVFVVHVV